MLPEPAAPVLDGPVLHHDAARGELPELVIRQAGDRYLLVEFGAQVLDLSLIHI